MFNVGGPEILVILVVALVVLGPQQLPKAVRTFGNVMAELRKVSSGFQDEIHRAFNEPIESKGTETGRTATTPEEADVTDTLAPHGSTGNGHDPSVAETVARNTLSANGHDASTAPTTGAAGSDHGSGPDRPSGPAPRPPIDPSDRAAG